MSPTSTTPPTFHRILTTHGPTTSSSSTSPTGNTDSSFPPVQILSDTLTLQPVLEGQAHIHHLFSTLSLPTSHPYTITPSHITATESDRQGTTTPNGVNCQVTDVAPYTKIKMHRTHSVDYNIILKGWMELVTPKEGGGEERTRVGEGEVVVQCGTLHAWEAGAEGCRWVSVIVAAKPVEVDGKELDEVGFQ